MSNIDQGGNIAGRITIATGGTLMVNDWLNFLNEYLGLIGMVVALMSVTAQIVFGLWNMKLQVKSLDIDNRERVLKDRERILEKTLTGKPVTILE